MQASVVLSPSSRLSQAAASDSSETLPWLSTTNAGAVPDPKMESPVDVEDRLSNVTGSGVATAVGAVEPCDVIPPAEAPAPPGIDWARTGARPKAPTLTSTPNRSHCAVQPAWSEVVCGGRNCSAAATPWPRLETLNRFAVLPDEAPAHPSDAAVVSPHLEASPSRVAVSPPSHPSSPARRICQPSTGKHSRGPLSAPKPSSSFRRRLLKEAVTRRRSEGLILQRTNPTSSPQQTPAVTTQPQPVAAVRTHISLIRDPPQRCLPYACILATQGQLPAAAF
ncbi:hypothetical protein KUCAC02_000816 [Chaenocephalus aceratus]|uniref:Uncharacterized protein n=1 Tax=Chaenocephalus aceratus TaxID=36190 RepID=A0ACB9W7Y9_CHAAC|nr:hypothetical protein KUCAC02_000816 [Chaenocephalus aceratus]